MLGHLARWLRAAGYDAEVVAPHTADEAIVTQARAEGRTVLTCDRRLVACDVTVLHLPMTPLPRLAAELAVRAGVDWLRAPFTRCLVDNTPLVPAPPAARARIPPPAHDMPGPFTLCPTCGRLFWPGSHVRRMQARLESLKQAATAARGVVPPEKRAVARTQTLGAGIS
jgi:uncharacterized protein with PIN domain